MKKTLLSLAIMSIAATASADSWLYAGAAAGPAKVESKHSSAVGLHVGTGILPIIGLEAGYWDFGETKGISRKSFYLAAKPSVDLGPIHLYAKAGMHELMSDIGGAEKSKDSGAMYGFGAEYFLIDNLSLGASYNNFNSKYHDDITVTTLSATFHFL